MIVLDLGNLKFTWKKEATTETARRNYFYLGSLDLCLCLYKTVLINSRLVRIFDLWKPEVLRIITLGKNCQFGQFAFRFYNPAKMEGSFDIETTSMLVTFR